MATNQVITITPDGDMQGLDHKRKGLDLRQFGKAKTHRATLIEWNEDLQMWFITWSPDVEYPPVPWDEAVFRGAGIDPADVAGFLMTMGSNELVVCFMDYEVAVAAEVAVIQAMQLKGYTHGLFP
jgi:hypothetical protein